MVERVVEGLPEADLVSSLDLVEETVDSGDGLALVVATQDDDLSWEAHLQGVQQTNDFAGLLASIYVITHEQVPSLHGDDAITLELVFVLLLHLLEHVEQVGVLAVDVAEDFYWSLKSDKSLLFLEYSSDPLDQKLDHLAWQVNNRYILRVLGLIIDDVIIQVVNDDVHDKHSLLVHQFLGNGLGGFLELAAPLFTNFEGF